MAQKQKKNKKWVLWIIMIGFFAVAALVVYLVCNNYFNKGEDFKSNDNSLVEDKHDNNKGNEDEEFEKPKVVQYDGDDPNTLEELSGVVTYAGVVNDKLMIRVNIDQYLEDGECNLVLTRNGENIYNEVVQVMGNVTTATCEGFDVPLNGLGQGTMGIIINITSKDKSGSIRSEVGI